MQKITSAFKVNTSKKGGRHEIRSQAPSFRPGRQPRLYAAALDAIYEFLGLHLIMTANHAVCHADRSSPLPRPVLRALHEYGMARRENTCDKGRTQHAVIVVPYRHPIPPFTLTSRRMWIN